MVHDTSVSVRLSAHQARIPDCVPDLRASRPMKYFIPAWDNVFSPSRNGCSRGTTSEPIKQILAKTSVRHRAVNFCDSFAR